MPGVPGLNARSGAAAVAEGSDLLTRIAAGDRLAESQFVVLYRRGVRALVRRQCRPLEPALDDLTQEVLFTLIVRLREGALRDPDALPAYLHATVVNIVRAEYRKRGRRGEFSADPAAIDADQAAAPDDRGAASAPEPPATLQRQQLARRVRELLAEMDVPRDQEVLRRYYLHEDDRATICRELDIDHDHFRRVLYRARERFGELARRVGLEEAR